MKQLILGLLLLTNAYSYAQNVQLHYDQDRECITSTVEMFKPDTYGNTYFFIDMDYNSNGAKGVTLAYWEISRVFKTEKMPFGIHAEFDGGMLRGIDNNNDFVYPINNAWLAGIDYSINAKDYSKGITFKALYKYITGKHNATYQFTTAWYSNFFDKKLTFSGFADFWREDNQYYNGDANTKFVFLSEPQLWYNINETFSLGGEIELTNNFGGVSGFKARPTLGVKWIF